ncbi:HypC/HybG/HupF family hydrogenase formation chaperone [Clostridium thailandense]|uniref:HypC/HybG/HupF family hydrogenase formation chaperone n=1 Tax=Clostridium thailandense TaxID=2794346 RepID=A0A949TFS0_9CLOT|nr:HypC/HybG/HupF family hydrogenase formation chaperone [Clostridium thailandense]MBV7271365.1 HypC/HybG/HupF family hydrogenase formation chaperone [Clostridium thailandense]
MCIAIPAKVININGDYAFVDIMGVESSINIQLIEKVNVGDYVLVHAGCGIQKIDINYFNYLQEVLKETLKSED